MENAITTRLLLVDTSAIEANVKIITDRFILAQDVRASSCETYRRALKQFFKWVAEKGYSVLDMTPENIIEYKRELEQTKSSLSVSGYLVAVRRFYGWCVNCGYTTKNIAEGVKQPKYERKFRKQPLSGKQSAQLVNATSNERDRALITLLLHCGLRTIEVVRADVGDITFKGGKRVLMVQGKGSNEKESFVILSADAWEVLKQYLDTRKGAKDKDPLFACESKNNKNGRLTTRSIRRIVKEYLQEIGLDEKAFSAHSLRHTCGTNILKATKSMEQTQKALRHMSPVTTQIYTATIEEELRLESNTEEKLAQFYRDNS